MSLYEISKLYLQFEPFSHHLFIEGFHLHKTEDSSFFLNISLLGSYAFQPFHKSMLRTTASVMYQGNAYNYDDLDGNANALAEYNHINLAKDVATYIESIPNSKYRWELRNVAKELPSYYLSQTGEVPTELVEKYSKDRTNTQPLIYNLLPFIPNSNLLVMASSYSNLPVAYIMTRYENGVLFYLGSFLVGDTQLGNLITLKLIEHAILDRSCTNFDFCNLVENKRTEYKKKFFNHKGYAPVVAHNMDVPWLNVNPLDLETFFSQ